MRADIPGKYEPVLLLEAGSFDQISVDIIFDPTCRGCYIFEETFRKLKQKYGKRLKERYHIVSRLNQPDYALRLYFVASHRGLGDRMRSALFATQFERMRPLSKEENVVALAQSFGLAQVYESEKNSAAINEQISDARRFAKQLKLNYFPSVVIERSILAEPSSDNLSAIFDHLLRTRPDHAVTRK